MAQVLRDNGFRHVEVTVECGDQGVDILAVRGGKTYAIQCKNYAGAVGNAAVQEAYAGAEYYGCDVPAVVCPTDVHGIPARELAESTGVELWDGERLSHMMRVSGTTAAPRPEAGTTNYKAVIGERLHFAEPGSLRWKQLSTGVGGVRLRFAP